MFSIANETNEAGEIVGVIYDDGRKIGTIEGGPAYEGDIRPRYVARGHEVVEPARLLGGNLRGETVYSTSIASSKATVEEQA